MDQIRSILYVPAHKSKWVEEATTHRSDAVILDLEDSVPADQKPSARRGIMQNESFLAQSDTVVTLRVNPVGSIEFFEDLDLVRPWLDAIVLPKVESDSEVRSVEANLELLEHRRGMDKKIELIPLLESPGGIFRAYEILSASHRVTAVGSGTSNGGDIQQSLNLGWSAEGFETLYLRSKIVLEARAAGVHQILSGIWATVDDEAGLREKANRQERFGFTGMQIIHPAQIEPVNEVFTPAQEEVEYYRELVAAFEGRQGDEQGVIKFDGEMVDAAKVKQARRVLERADEFGIK